MLFVPLLGFATTDSTKTTVTKVIEKPQSVVISKDGGTTTVFVSGKDGDPKYKYKFEVQNGAVDTVLRPTEEEWSLNLPFLKNGRATSTFISGGEDIYVDMMWPDAKSSGMKTSFEVGIGRLISFNWLPGGGRTKLTFGVGTGTRVISFEHDRRLFFSNGHLSLGKPTGNEKIRASKILEAELRFPFMFTTPIYRDFKFSIGAVGIWNIYSKASTTWELDGTKYSENFKGLHQRTFNCEFVGTLGFDDAVGITFHYRPLSDFTKVYGPEFKTISLGLSFNF